MPNCDDCDDPEWAEGQPAQDWAWLLPMSPARRAIGVFTEQTEPGVWNVLFPTGDGGKQLVALDAEMIRTLVAKTIG